MISLMACQNNANDFPSSSGNTIWINCIFICIRLEIGKLGSFIVHVHCTVQCTVYTSGGKLKGKAFPLNPGTIAKDGKQPTSLPAIKIDNSRKL